MAGQIKGITIEFDGKTTKLEQAIKRVKNSTNDVDKALKDVNRGLKYDPKNVTLLSQKQQLLTKRVEESKQKVNDLKNAQAQLDAKGVDRASAEYQELEREIVRAEAEQKRFEKELRQLSSVKLTALGEQFKQIGSKMTEAGKSMTMYVTAPLAAVGAAGAKSFAEVDKTMQLTNSTMGNTAEQAEMLNKAMKDAAANSTYGMSDAATATLNFARAGLSAEQAASALAPAMNLAAGEGGNLDTVSGGLVATINGFGGSFDEAAQYADVFANACNNSALDIDSLSQSMSVAAPIFSAAGYKVNDAALYMGVMANKGIEANVAANSLKTGFARLVGGSADVQKQLDALGVSIVNADGSMKDTVTIQKDLHEAFAGLSESEQIAAASTIFGKNQMSNWLALINTAPSEVSALSAALDEEGTTAEMAEAMMSGFGGSLEKLKSSVDVAKTSLGEALAPIILKVAEGIQKLVDWFNSLSPTAQRIIAVVGAIVAAIGPLLVIGGTILTGLGNIMIYGPMIINMLSGVGAAVKGLLAGALNPWVIGIGLAIAAGVLLYKNWDSIKAFALNLWNSLKTTFEGIKTSIMNAWNAIKTGVTTAVNAIKTVIQTVFAAIVAIITGYVNAYRTVITVVFNAIKSVVTTIFTAIKTAVTTIWNGIKLAITNPVQAARNAVTNAVNAIKSVINGISGIIGNVKSAFSSIKSAMTSPIESAKQTISNVISKIKGMFPLSIGKIFSNLKLPHISVNGGKAPYGIGGKGSLPSFSVSWYAKGGIFDNPSIIGVGEAGREIVTPERLLDEKLTASNANIEALLVQMIRQNQMMIEELRKDKDLKIDKRVAGRIVNELVTV